MGLRKWFGFGGRGAGHAAEPSTMPWDRRPSIYEHIRAHTGADGRLDPAGENLPDEAAQGSGIRWAPGAFDGVITHHTSPGGEADKADAMLDLIRAYSQAPTAANKLKIYAPLTEDSTLAFIDALLGSLRKAEGISPSRTRELALSFATEAPDRTPVKFGIALLGMFDAAGHREVFMTLGRHDEFTLYCTVSMLKGSAEPEQDLFELARQVDGWGRIHIVERLAETQDPAIKAWMLREGFRNSVMNEYLAYTCATTGGLLSALSEDQVDEDLLIGAGLIIDALLIGGPAQNIDDYDDGVLVVELYLTHLASRASTLMQLLTVDRIRSFLSSESPLWEKRESRGWTPEKRSALANECQRIIERPQWRAMVLRDSGAEADETFFVAKRSAKIVGIDLWERIVDRLEASPVTMGRWYDVMEECNNQRIEQVVEIAVRRLPLKQIASGPAKECGMGKQFEPHRCLETILQELGRFPGHGGELVEVGLRSPTLRCRSMALRALSGWERDNWPPTMEMKLRTALAAEPDAQMQSWMEKVLAGEAMD
jgi:hypothetical protein